jgi:hypothetical protein
MASSTEKPELPTACLRDLFRWFKASKAQGALIGAVAVSLLGRPRSTRDVDAMASVSARNWPAFLATGRQFGFEPRADEQETLQFAHEARVLLMRHLASGIEVDIVLAALPFEKDALARARTLKVARCAIRVISPEDLIVMKAAALRPRDIADISGILELHPKLDLVRIRRLTGELAELLESPEIVEELERLLSAQRRRRSGKR